ncbi:DMT family transporter [Agreia bicolorata]|uniref:Multidrug transporter n=1 Tax=Agreia bicolorata TaxID=110935 RepID=A0ABR5CHM7_9MICO|nr:EamA family transporter [Agreia bicolorata]KJC65069.1 multidrug transporter [Agreia bicolorata]
MPPMLAVLLAALCFSTTGTAQSLAHTDATPLSIGAARVLIGGAILGIAALIALRRSPARASAPAVDRPAARIPAVIVIAVGAIGVLAYQPAFFAGTRVNGVAVGTVIALGSAPIVTGVLDAIIRRRIPGARWGLATTVALVGVVLVSGLVGSGATGSVNALGLAASLGAGVSYAVYAIASKVLLDRGWSTTGAMGSIFGTAAVLSLPVLLLTSTAWLVTPKGIALALWLGVVTTAVAYLLFGWGLKRLNPTTVATLTLAEPLTATLLGLIVLHEQLSPISIAGLAVIAAGLTLLSISPRKETADVAQAA